ncbi:hypothetical protein [Vibrio panuliri]|uniref:Uncharacterized protein n=1 Tax=Vibrio panuliri TaxID=1381081 RepID=A0A1Q9HQW3_9VIBR|nr:hypothetical protein [Vibrio panuliri]KAB1458154.1 hypothetical protein F7O85_10630 [Vibrio panuliri]OLQ89463.1 hypothetical protein BIY20_01570 [Vibrio panuliri]OLQ93268.1 hypothetical protein BIY22_01910 [Vibrio panuliri]
MNSFVLTVLLLTTSPASTGPDSLPLKCELLETKDTFLYYRPQKIYQSEQFVLFQNFKGRVISQVDLKTGEMIRTTYLGDNYDPNYQILKGRCKEVNHTLDFWALDQVSYDR